MKKYNNEKIVVSLTSWTKRIDTAYKTIDSLLKWCNYCHIVLVLAKEEFPNQEKDLPETIMHYLNDDLIELLWVDKNYKSYKKYFWTAAKYPNSVIVTADDDCIYKEDYVKVLYDQWLTNTSAVVTYSSSVPISEKYKSTCLQYGECTLYPPNYYGEIGLKLVQDEDMYNIIKEKSQDDNFHSALREVLNKTDYIVIKQSHSVISDMHDEVCVVTHRRNLSNIDVNSEEYKNKLAIIDKENFDRTEFYEKYISAKLGA